MQKVLKNEYFLKTIIFILGVIVFLSYWFFLGNINAFVGVALVKGALTLLNKDLTANPIKNSLIFLVAFLYIGIFSYIATFNIFLGLFINFFALFFITYNFVSDLTMSIWIPFVLGYLYLLVKPVNYFYEFKERLIALAVGSLFIIISQLILNKDKSKDKIKSNFILLLDSILNEISTLKNEDILETKRLKESKEYRLENKNLKVTTYLDSIVATIYNRRTSFFYIDDNDSILLNLSVCLERLSNSINKIKLTNCSKEEEFLSDLVNLINEMKIYIKKDNYYSKFTIDIESFSNKYSKYFKDNYSFYDILQNIEMLKFSLTNLIDLKNKKRVKIKNVFSSFNKFKIKNIFKYNFRKSIKFTYAFRLSFLLSVSYFIVELFKIPEGKWITFTIFTVVQPYIEDSQKRFTKRFKGTIVGIIIFSLIDIFVGGFYLEVFIFAIFYYIYSIQSDFTIKTICTTTVSLGVFSIITNAPASGDFYRFIFMVIGILIGYIGSKYIFPYSLKDSIDMLSKQYYKISLNMVYKGCKEKINAKLTTYIDEQVLLSKLFESKIIINNSTYKLKCVNEFVYNQRFLNNDMYYLYFYIFKNKIKSNIIEDFKFNLSKAYSFNNNELILDLDEVMNLETYIKGKFSSVVDEKDKLVFITIYRILSRLEKSKKLIDEIDNTIII